MTRNDVVNKVLMVMIFILAGIVVVSLILKIAGHSPTDLTILYSLVALLIVSAFKLHYHQGKFDEFAINTKISFQHIREDIKELKEILQKKIKER